ncbi:hypothetical protein [Pseudaminobacter soli (ex Zhang et al. 2022)]|uniref:hypothetical protein n=1 Tax=Pseudaminobacter soli (ex Zhang et al. 2022) TaxID=2831468 RepID=UPI001AEDBF1C|nr:hypothetical protein [Pseudaminobacter soli]
MPMWCRFPGARDEAPMLMSPLSISQYLPPNQSLFDMVIFDEASQITAYREGSPPCGCAG